MIIRNALERDKFVKNAEFLNYYLFLTLRQQNFVMNAKKYFIKDVLSITVQFVKNEMNNYY